ncbi:MAG: hypothetical protein WAN65_32950 [Candidatus Sulfotelmatobacter sp.]
MDDFIDTNGLSSGAIWESSSEESRTPRVPQFTSMSVGGLTEGALFAAAATNERIFTAFFAISLLQIQPHGGHRCLGSGHYGPCRTFTLNTSHIEQTRRIDPTSPTSRAVHFKMGEQKNVAEVRRWTGQNPSTYSPI